VWLRKGRSFFQAVYLIPYVIAPVTNALIWANIIFSPSGGLFGYLRRLGFTISSPLGNMKTALYGVAGVDIWHYWGFLTVVYLAALRQTPVDQIEAAEIEGINGWQLFWKVYLPNIAPTIKMMFIFIIIYSFLTFDYVYLLTTGGPAHATEMLSTYAYNIAFNTFRFGMAAAVALVMSIFGAIAAFFYTYLSRKEVSE
jgi:raffinose/stachyose/melibiose transport system permease protein